MLTKKSMEAMNDKNVSNESMEDHSDKNKMLRPGNHPVVGSPSKYIINIAEFQSSWWTSTRANFVAPRKTVVKSLESLGDKLQRIIKSACFFMWDILLPRQKIV